MGVWRITLQLSATSWLRVEGLKEQLCVVGGVVIFVMVVCIMVVQ